MPRLYIIGKQQGDDIAEAKRYYFKAQDALKGGKWIKSIHYLKKALEAKEDYMPACRVLADIYHQHGNLSEAQQYITTALTISPNDPASLFTQGVIYLNMGYIVKAMESFQKASENGEMTWALAYNLGLCLYELEKYESSIQFLNQAIQADPSQIQPYLLMAQNLMRQKQPDEAKIYLMKVKKIRPCDPQIDQWISNILNSDNFFKE